MALVKFKRGSLAAYTAATKSADTLYFVTDEHRIYMGEVPYSGGIYKEVAALPATGEINTIYKVTDTSEGSAVNGDVAYWDGTKYVYLVDMSDIQAALDGKAAATHEHEIADTIGLQAVLDDKATFLTRSAMDAALAQLGIATPLNYANAKTLMANAGVYYQDGELCANVLAMAEVINALCAQIDEIDAKLNSAPPPAVKVAMVEYALTGDPDHIRATAPTVSGYTFVCWVDFRPTIGYGVWKAANYAATATDVWPQVPASVTTYPKDKKIQCYALYTRNS